jgi:MoaA/NifB/PqqE/SkfB family radical SAM enzyme
MQVIDKNIFEKNQRAFYRLIKAYYKRHFFRDGTPFVFSFLVTNRCFLKCKHCFYHETIGSSGMRKEPSELTIDEYASLSEKMQWFMFAIICGGEPFIRDDLHEIINIFRTNNGMPWCDSATNGQLTESILRQVELICKQDKTKTYSLSFSIDGFEEENDHVRGENTYSKSIETWKECKKLLKHHNNLELNLCTTMNSVNQHSLSRFFKWSIKKLQPNRITLLKIRQSPRSGEHLKDVDLEKYKMAKDVIEDSIANNMLGDVNDPHTHYNTILNKYVYESLSSGKRSFYCYAGKHGAWIDYNGAVNVCEVFEDRKLTGNSLSIGNLRDYDMDFLKLWNSKKAQQIKQYVGKHTVCANCSHETEGLLPSMYFEPNTFKIK